MRLAVLTTFAASRKEPLSQVLERIHAGFGSAGLSEPVVRFTFVEGPLTRVSSVDRVLKRLPQLEPFVKSVRAGLGGAEAKSLSNVGQPDESAETPAFENLLEIARGVPRSFPFHSVLVNFWIPAFGEVLQTATKAPIGLTVMGAQTAGITVTDSWWVNARQRAVLALHLMDADPEAKKLPPPSSEMAKLFAACGKARKTAQVPLDLGVREKPSIESKSRQNGEAIRTIVNDYKARIFEIVERAQLPHDLPPIHESLKTSEPVLSTGPKKPDLVRCFEPLGYDCRGENGSFTLRRRTASNLSVDVVIDSGTWFHALMAFLRVRGLVDGVGYKASLVLPVSRQATIGAQFQYSNAEGWRMAVENLAALVAELDNSFVPAIEAAAGPSPEWYKPEDASPR